jgi:hypothetical protein
MNTKLQFFASLCALCGVLAMASMALEYPFELVFACLCISSASAFALLGSLARQRAQLEAGNHVLGQFMRGGFQARTHPGHGDDALTRLEHRINNLLDVLDLQLRGDDAAIDRTSHGDYIEKLRLTALSSALQPANDTPGEAAKEEASVGALLQQLGHDVANLFAEDAAPIVAEAAEEAVESAFIHRDTLLAMQQRLQDGALALQQACTQLSQQALPGQGFGPGPSPATLESALTRLAEQSTVIALNVAIESNRAGEDSSLTHAAEELQAMAALLHKARQDVSAALAPHHRQGGPVAVPLAVAVEALARAEQSLREDAVALADIVGDAPTSAWQEAA